MLVLKTATGDHSFNIEVMVTKEERELGLMFRRSLLRTAACCSSTIRRSLPPCG